MRKITKSSLCPLLRLVFLGMWLFSCPLWAQEKAIKSQYPLMSPKLGERCIVCGVLLTENDTVLIVRGRRVPLKRAMVDSFLSNQEKYFSQKQPKSALFQEELDVPVGVAQGGISLSWFLIGLYTLVGLIFGGMSGYTAVSKGFSPIPHFFIGLLFNVFGYLYVLTRKATAQKGEIPAGLVKVPITHAPVPCWECGRTNHPSARHCADCGAELEPKIESEVDRTS